VKLTPKCNCLITVYLRIGIDRIAIVDDYSYVSVLLTLLSDNNKFAFSGGKACSGGCLYTDPYADPGSFCDLRVDGVGVPVKRKTEIMRYFTNKRTTVTLIIRPAFSTRGITRERLAATSAPPTSARFGSTKQRTPTVAADIPITNFRRVCI